MEAARSRRLRPADQSEVVQRCLDDARDVAQLGPPNARHRIEVHAQFVRMIEILRAYRMRVQLEAGEIGHPQERGRIARNDFFSAPARRKTERDDFDP